MKKVEQLNKIKTENRLQPNPWDAKCPSRAVIALLANKWTLLLFPVLSERPHRNGELLRRLDGVSQKVLTETLRELENNGLVIRRDFQEVPPKVEYELSELGRGLAKTIGAVDDWVVNNFYEMQKARQSAAR